MCVRVSVCVCVREREGERLNPQTIVSHHPFSSQAFEKGDPKADENIRSIIAIPHSPAAAAAAAAANTSTTTNTNSADAVTGGSSNPLHGAVHACLSAVGVFIFCCVCVRERDYVYRLRISINSINQSTIVTNRHTHTHNTQALATWDPEKQKKYLQAASYGKKMCVCFACCVCVHV